MNNIINRAKREGVTPKNDEIELSKVLGMGDTLKPAPTTKKAIEEAIQDVYESLLENLEAGKAVLLAEQRKSKAHYRLQKAKERLSDLEEQIKNN